MGELFTTDQHVVPHQLDIEYKNFILQNKGIVQYISKRYLYSTYVHGCDGLMVAISCCHPITTNIKDLLMNRSITLLDMVVSAKCDDTQYSYSSKATTLSATLAPFKKKDMRPILFIIYSETPSITSAQLEVQEEINTVKSLIDQVIEEANYEKSNYLTVIHTPGNESDLFEGLEWMFAKRSG